jgi:arylesterase/paraoxonase
LQGLREIGFGSHLPPRNGNILLFDFNKPDNNPHKLHLSSSSNFDPKQFNPHGLSYWQDPNSRAVQLFVVNHLQDGNTIELFEYHPPEYTLKHIKSVQHPLMSSPNDIVAISAHSFYFTNDHYFCQSFLKKLEDYLQMALSSVGFYNGETMEAKYVASSLKFPNGINISPDKRFIYITTSVGLELIIYRRNESDNSLTLAQVIQMADSCDNLFICPHTGDIWTGCHPRIIDVIQHLYHNFSHQAGSLVLRIQLGPENLSEQGVIFPHYQIDQVYSNDGWQLKGSSAAIYYGGKLLIGSVVDNLVYCEALSLQ